MEFTKRQNEIIDAALRLTAKGGIRNLTVKHISEEIGVTEPAIYRHFRNKSEIVKALIGRFDLCVSSDKGTGLDDVRNFIRGRFAQVVATPELARVMFAEELFMEDSEFTRLMVAMMHRHKEGLSQALREAQNAGEIRQDIPLDMIFRILVGPVRLLIKQWGMTGGAFDLQEKGDELLETLFRLLR